ncbi:MAG: hypothetical protein GPJ54_08040 [Candidatus Heimdallarchaeota archaeon]|nr:hypothetical protein [Candidatus Heimdallarchaeota archaeon]
MRENETFTRYGKRVKQKMKNQNVSNNKYAAISMSEMHLSAVYNQEQVSERPIGGLNIVYSPGKFMSVDRITEVKGKYEKQRRIIYYLDSRPGQIGCTLLLQLLKINDGDEFSKHKFVQRIDEEFFQAEGLNISSGEINEALSRMFRKTMIHFFEIKGRNLVRKNFEVRINELNSREKHYSSYNFVKREIDDQTKSLINELNGLL